MTLPKHPKIAVSITGAFLFLLVIPETPVLAQRMIQPRRLINLHTAGVLPRGYFDLETRVQPGGDTTLSGAGILFNICVGLTDRLTIGTGYGGDGIVGRGNARGNPYPGALIKYRLIEESFALPGIALGYEHQGFGGIETQYRGYVYKSQGFFGALSKNFLLFSLLQIGFHGGIDYSLEESSVVFWPNFYTGLDLEFNEEFGITVEYDAALNERDAEGTLYYNPRYGFLNAGIRWAFSPNLYLEFAAEDILEQKVRNSDRERTGWSRALKIVYLSDF